MSVKPCPSPRVCAHEPLIREGLAAASRLAGLQDFRYAPWSANEGPEPCIHGYRKGVACPQCDRLVLERAYEFVTMQAPWIELPCVSGQITELRATVAGLNDKVASLLESSRRSELALDIALRELRTLQSENGKPRSAVRACSVEDPDVRLRRLVNAADSLVEAMERCHICSATLLVDDGPIYCGEGGCSPYCEEHEEPPCPPISGLHAALKYAVHEMSGVVPDMREVELVAGRSLVGATMPDRER
jgi:hypothetical protein